jgi:hypothetical protein
MLKHIGRHGDRKVAILFREVPGEEHMCLVVYPDVLPSHIHDSIMKTLESPVGQQANNLAEALHRNFLPDGRVQLEALHREGMIKKVPANQVIVTPTATNTIKLDELNRLVREMETGTEAAERMKQLDDSTGLVDPAVKRKHEQEFKRQQLEKQMGQQSNAVDAALDDKTIASNMLSQAKRMEQDAKGLIAEAARLKKDAQRMFPGVTAVGAVDQPVELPTLTEVVNKPARGRKPKVTASNVNT